MLGIVSLQEAIDFIKSGVSGYGFFLAMWGFIAYISNRVKNGEVLAKRNNDDRLARNELARVNKDRDEAQAQSDRYRQNITLELERRNRTLSIIAREVRHLLNLSMTISDLKDRWIAILEGSAKVHEPELMKQKPDFTVAPTVADVTAIYIEHAADAEGGDDK